MISTDLDHVIRSGDDSATVFSFSPLTIYANSNLKVYLIDETVDPAEPTLLSEGASSTTYSVSVSALPGTGSITYPASGGTPLTTSQSLYIVVDPGRQQDANFENNGGYSPKTIERLFDKMQVKLKTLWESVDRSIRIPRSFEASPPSGELDFYIPGYFVKAKDDGTGFTMGAAVDGDAIEIPLPVNQGGTGSITAAAARTALAVPGLTTSNTFSGATNTFNGAVVIAPTALSTTRALDTAQSGPTSPGAGPFIYNQIAINNDSAPTGDTRTMGLYMQFNSGGTSEAGAVIAAFFNMNHNVASPAASGDHIALVGQMVSSVVDAGSGEIYGGNLVCYANSGATTPGVNGLEVDVKKDSGATVTRRDGVRVVNEGNSTASSARDAAFSVYSTTSGGGFKVAFLISDFMGQDPLQATADVMAFDGAQTVDDVFDLTNLTITTNLIRYTNFTVTAAGGLTMAGVLTISSTVPEIIMFESDAAADTKYWDLNINGGSWKLDILTDAFGGRTNFITLTRSTNTPSLFAITTALHALSGTSIPAGGTAGAGLRMSSTSNFGVFFGSGAPSLSAAQGSIYLRSDGSSTSTRLYVNTNGTTGWTNFTSAT